MPLRSDVEKLFARHVSELTQSADFMALESGRASRSDYDRFIENVFRCHTKSPHFLAFLFTLAPPEAISNLTHNLLEEMGIEEETGQSHPSLLRQLAVEAGLSDRLPALEARAQDDLRQVIVDPLLYGTLRDVGLAVLCEVVAFEYMLSRVASRIARALQAHRDLSAKALEWFTHHSEVDIRHAEQGIDNLEAYVRYYEFSPEDAMTICEMTLRENVFVTRYFGELGLGPGITRSA
jgi:pyrroloquinoline quinone (PQQ) biosynthesis protein C